MNDHDAVITNMARRLFDGAPVSGYVKCFDVRTGFGFVICEGVDQDLFLHASVLREIGLTYVTPNSAIVVRVARSEKGARVSEVLSVAGPDHRACAGDAFDPTGNEASYEFQPARIKWYVEKKGYGFANVFGDSTDYYFNRHAIACLGITSVTGGEAILASVEKRREGGAVRAFRLWLPE